MATTRDPRVFRGIRPIRPAVAVAPGDLAENVTHDFLRTVGTQLFLHAPQRHADHVAMMQFGPEATGAQFEPEPMHQVDILGPEARGMRAEVEENSVFLILEYKLQR